LDVYGVSFRNQLRRISMRLGEDACPGFLVVKPQLPKLTQLGLQAIIQRRVEPRCLVPRSGGKLSPKRDVLSRTFEKGPQNIGAPYSRRQIQGIDPSTPQGVPVRYLSSIG